jgi:hypothetical protein
VSFHFGLPPGELVARINTVLRRVKPTVTSIRLAAVTIDFRSSTATGPDGDLHLSHREGATESWFVELAGHHASIPLIFAILYQDFRFAFADIFLKRALSFIFLAALIYGIFVAGVMPILNGNPTSERSIALLRAMWVLTALVYPLLRRSAGWLIDKVVLRREDYALLTSALSNAIDRCQTPAAA